MSLEDAKNRLQQYQAKLQEEQGRRDQAQEEQTAIENELSRMVSDAVEKSIYSQDDNINQLKREIHITNENYLLLHRDMVELNDILSDTTHLQAIYDTKFKELESKHQERKDSLDKAYKQLIEANNTRIANANADADDQLKRIDKRLEDLRAKKREEERKLRGEIDWIRTKAGAIIIGLIVVFIIALILGWSIGSNLTGTTIPY